MAPRNLLYLAVATLTLAQGGCLWIAAGAAGGAAVGYAYNQGKVCQTFAASFDDTWAATRTALADLGMPLLEEERENGGNGFYKSQVGKDDVRIYLDVQSSRFPADGPQTRVCVRVATFGDQPASARLLDQIGAHLAPPGASAVPPGTPPPLAPQPVNLSPPTVIPPPPPPGALPTTTAPPPLAAPETAPVPRSVDGKR